MELTGSRDRWVLIGDDCWEAAAAGCTELFPATPIVSRRLNPSKCLCALAVWSDGGGQGQSKVSLAPAVCISLRFYSPIHPSTYPPTYLPSTHVLLIHPLTTHPSTHLPTPPSIHPPFHPSILLLPSGSNSSPLSSLLICHVPGTTLGPSILAHSLVLETEHHNYGGMS